MEMKEKWNIISEMVDEETGEPTCWSKEINHPKYGKYVWITENGENIFDIEINRGSGFTVLKTCKSLASAKRWVSINLCDNF